MDRKNNMDSKVQKAVFNNIDQLLSKIEDQCDVPKSELWTLWKSMFNFPEEVQKKPRKTKDQVDSPAIASSSQALPVTKPLAAPKKTKPATKESSVSEDVATEKLQFSVKPPAPIVEKPSSPAAPIVEKPAPPVVTKEEEFVIEEEEFVIEEEAQEDKKEAAPPKKEATPPKKEATPPKKEATPPKKEATPTKGDGCCFVLVKGARRGEKCGDPINKAYLDIGMCRVHGKKQ
jgi:hypothetical protein